MSTETKEVKPTETPKTWGTSTSVRKFEDVFKTPAQMAKHKKGIKVLAWGAEDTFKSGFALSFPPPLYSIDTELGQPPLFQYYVNCPQCHKETQHILYPDGKIGQCSICGDLNGTMKAINWCDATYLDPNTDDPDPKAALDRLEGTIALLKDIGKDLKETDPIPGTIIIDSGTDTWDWIQAWLEGVGKHTKEGNYLMQTEWAKAKQRWRQLILRLMAKPMHIVMTAQPQEIYAGKQATGEFRPRLQPASQHIFDIVIHCMKWETRIENQPVKVRYMSEITKCRFKKGWRAQFEEISYDKLTMALKKECGVEVW
jgi:hypothetical protein